MKWNCFIDANPNTGFDILIVNYSRKETDLMSMMQPKYFTCKSSDYMRILGENNMDKRMSFWTKIIEPIIKE